MNNLKRAVLATFGTLGDIYSFIAIALALKDRGFSTVIVAPEMHRRAIESEGIDFVRLRPDMHEALGADFAAALRQVHKNPFLILDEIYLRYLAETYADVMEVGRGADVIISHSLLVGAHQAAERLGLPCARVALAPLHLQSAISPSRTPPAPYILEPRSAAAVGYNRILRAIIRRKINLRMGRLRAFRKAIGLPPSGEDFFLDFGRKNNVQAVFGLFSSHFASAQQDHPANLIVPGFPFFKSVDSGRCTLPPKLRSFVTAGEPPIIFTLGSFVPEASGSFYDESLRAVRTLGRRAILLTGAKDAGRLASFIGPNELVCESAPHSLLFPHALCIVHHGGIGTTAEALRAGKPQIVVPFFGDQPDHAARIERLGLGLSIKSSAYTQYSVTAGLKKITSSDYSERAIGFARHIAAEKGVAAIADWSESLSRAQ